MRPTPTAKLERHHDTVYEATTNVVRAVMSLSQSVQSNMTNKYLDKVKSVGIELRRLLAAVDVLVPAFPVSTHLQVRGSYAYLCLYTSIL